MTLKRICVFCGSNAGIREDYATGAAALAKHLAALGIGIVYGGGNTGLMGALANAALEAGGEITGIMPEFLVAKEKAHRGLANFRIVKTMHERKALMADLADAFIAMPGGYGTFEEFFEVLTWTQLGLQAKPCGLLNVAGFYDPLRKMFERASEEGFVHAAHRDMVVCEADPELLVRGLQDRQLPLVDKWDGRPLT